LRPRDRPGRDRHPAHAGADFADPLWAGLSLSRAILEEGGVAVVYLERDAALMHALTLGA